MDSESNLGREKFPIGSSVRIKSAEQLDNLKRDGGLRYPPSTEQIGYGGRTDTVRAIRFSDGGGRYFTDDIPSTGDLFGSVSIAVGVLYLLKTAPGIWHEELLESHMAEYSPLLPHIRESLKAIEASGDGDLVYYPCQAVLKSGEALDTVYIVSEKPYLKHWGVYPENDQGKRWIRMEDIAEVRESPSRLPAKFAKEIYRNGESGMGYTIFTVVFADGVRQACVSGNAIDFIQYPTGKGPNDVVAVIPHEGRRDDSLVNSPEWYWCLYSE